MSLIRDAFVVKCKMRVKRMRFISDIKGALRPGYRRARRWLSRVWMLHYYCHDLLRAGRYMTLWPGGGIEQEHLAARLFFYYHKIEKGLSLPEPHRLFGINVIPAIFAAIREWEHRGFLTESPAYLGALAALKGYERRLVKHRLDPDDIILGRVKSFLDERPAQHQAELETPWTLTREQVEAAKCIDGFERLCVARRSYRQFAGEEVPRALIDRAISLAQLSPSVCNRQASRLWILEDAQAKRDALALQNGNRGFGHTADKVAVVTADMRFFTNATERNQPYVDAGLFAMSFVLALQAQGVMSCCLNWCAKSSTDRALHERLQIPRHELIVMLIAIGAPRDSALVPRSHRRTRASVTTYV